MNKDETAIFKCNNTHRNTFFKYTRNQKVKDIKHRRRREKHHIMNTICNLTLSYRRTASVNCCHVFIIKAKVGMVMV